MIDSRSTSSDHQTRLPLLAWLGPICALVVLMGLPTSVFAQSGPNAQSSAPAVEPEPAGESSGAPAAQAEREVPFSEAHRKRIYDGSKLSPTKAVLWTLAFPGLGNFYAEQYFYGALAGSFGIFTAIFIVYAYTTDQPVFYWFGAATGAAAYGGGLATSVWGVYNYNHELRRSLKVPEETAGRTGPDLPALGGRTLGFGWSFRF